MDDDIYEYVSVQLPDTPWKTRDRDTTQVLNEVSAHGWRLIAIQPQYDALSKPYAIFEKRKNRG